MFKGTVIDTVVKILLTLVLAGVIIAILPTSPFSAIIESIGEIPMIGYINWFFPIGKFIAVLSVWASAILIYYGVAWIFRQLGIIGS